MTTCPNCGNKITTPVRFCPNCGRPSEAPVSSEEFKIVTVVFCDVVKSTAMGQKLDELPLRRVMDRYGEIVRRVFAGHGGSVGRRHGDGFMAAFGIPELHEDDALRAIRAVSELRAALGDLDAKLQRERGLGLKVRLGVNTGTVLVRDAGAIEDEVTGKTVTVAKRLEEAAGGDQILIGAETYRLVADAVHAEKASPITIDGLDEPEGVWRLVEVLPDRPARMRRLDAPLIGRDREQRLLFALFERAAAERSCHLVTVLGFAGIGKSRLVDEFVVGLGDRATVLRGHCLAYGDSTALWPMVEIVRQAAGVAPTDPPAEVHERLKALVRNEERGERIAGRVAQVLGFGFDKAAGPPEEDTFWALRRLLETLARHRPLVVVVDDLQWGEPTLLDAIEHVAEAARDTPIMVICMARPDELFRRRQYWPGGKVNSTSLLLSPLGDTEGEQLVGHLLDGRVDTAAKAHITEWAQGFPFIVEELVANLRDADKLKPVNGHWELHLEAGGEQGHPGVAPWEEVDRRSSVSVPLSIQALLLTRLGRLDAGGRAIIERAAVVGEQFHTRDIEVLQPGSTSHDVTVGLEELVRLDLVRPDHTPAAVPLPPGSGESYRFRHIMIRTVAYDRMPDDRRAELHERYADWLEQNTEDRRSQFDELVGYHLYEAYRYTQKLDPDGDRARELGRRAGERHAEAGLRAAIRGDNQLTMAWLDRAARLLPAGHPSRLRVLPPLAEALQEGKELVGAMKAYEEIASAAEKAGDDGLAAHAKIGLLHVTAQHGPERFLREGRDQIELATPVFNRLDDQLGLAKAWHLFAYWHWVKGHLAAANDAATRAGRFAHKAGNPHWEARIRGLHCFILYWGPSPLEEVDRHSQEALAFARRSGMRSLEADALTVLARIAAMRGDFPKANELMRSAWTIAEDVGRLLTHAAEYISQALIRVLGGELTAAEATLRDGYRTLERMGATGPRANVAAMLARVLLLQERYEEAEDMTRICEQIAPGGQVDVQIKWRAIRALVLARRDELEHAEELARAATAKADETDQLESRAEAYVDLAEVLRLGGRHAEAAMKLERAVALYEEKGNEVAERNARKLLGRIRR
jgi:class 3 adenylate cyclase/tetratricopeptide (TPR) repeat protein